MYALKFEGQVGETRYKRCYTTAFTPGRAPAVAEWADLLELQKKLRSVGKQVAEAPTGTELPSVYELAADAVVSLERSELQLLLALMKSPMWQAHILATVQECVTWLESLKPEVPSVQS